MAAGRRRMKWQPPPEIAALLAISIAATACQRTPAAPTGVEPPAATNRLEPDGLVTLTEQPFEGLTTLGWGYLRRTSSKDAEIITDNAAPFSPPNVLRMVFTPGMGRDTEPSVHWVQLGGPREVYARWWIKLSPNWRASPAGGGKIAFLWPHPGMGVVYSNIAGSAPPHHINLATTWEPAYRFWEPNVTATSIRYDRWYQIDWYVRWSSAATAADGMFRWAVDGVLNGEYTDVRFPPGDPGFWQFEFAPTLQLPPPSEQYMYIDHATVSTRAATR